MAHDRTTSPDFCTSMKLYKKEAACLEDFILYKPIGEPFQSIFRQYVNQLCKGMLFFVQAKVGFNNLYHCNFLLCRCGLSML